MTNDLTVQEQELKLQEHVIVGSEAFDVLEGDRDV